MANKNGQFSISNGVSGKKKKQAYKNRDLRKKKFLRGGER